MRIEISVQDFARTNKGLINVLSALQRLGGEVSTRKLLYEIKTTGYGVELIKRAQRMGYIRREEREPDSGRGFHPVYNILTPKGKALLQKL